MSDTTFDAGEPNSSAVSKDAVPSSERPRIEYMPAWMPNESAADEISLVDVVGVLLRHRWTIFRLTVLLAVLAGTYSLVRQRRWTAATSFTPQTSTQGASSGLAALAGEFGIEVGGGEPGASPDFYAELVTSREILQKVAADTFEVQDTTGLLSRGRARGTLADLLGVHVRSAEQRRDAVVRWLKKHAASSVAQNTGVIRVSVTTPWAAVSNQIAGRLLDLVNEFNLRSRQSQAGAERRFVEGRMVEAGDSLRSAENALQRFLQDNRTYQSSPGLAFQEDRLQREVNMRQAVYTSLAQAYEKARIAEVRNTPVITVVESPETPVRPDPRHLLLNLILGVVLGGMIGVGTAFVLEYVRKARVDGAPEVAEVSALWRDAKDDLRRLTRRLRRNP